MGIEFIKNKKFHIDFKNKSIRFCILFFVVWSIYSIITVVMSKDLYGYIITNFYVCIGTLNIIFFTKYIDVDKNKNNIFNIINISVFINCLYYLYLYFVEERNIGGFYHNSNDLATVVLLAIFISVNLIINNKNKYSRIAQIVLLLTFVFCFVNILSRACVLGVCFAILMLVIMEMIRNRKEIAKSKYLKILVIVLLIICIVAIAYIWKRYIVKISLTPIENARSSNEVRVNMIYNAIYFLSMNANLITGIGAGNSEYFLENSAMYTTNEIYNFHNFWLELIVEYGIFILIAFIAVYFIICKELYVGKGKNILKSTNSVFLLFFLSFIIASISASSIITRGWIWIVFALTIAYINKCEKKEEG